jgi:hypothetical protein
LALKSHSRAVPSQLPVTTQRLSGLIATAVMGPSALATEVLQVWRFDPISWADAPHPIDFRTVQWRQFEPEVILLAVGWYLRFSLSYREVEELLAERCLLV